MNFATSVEVNGVLPTFVNSLEAGGKGVFLFLSFWGENDLHCYVKMKLDQFKIHTFSTAKCEIYCCQGIMYYCGMHFGFNRVFLI